MRIKHLATLIALISLSLITRAQISIKSTSDQKNPIRIADLTIKVNVIGNIATTNFDLTVANSSDKTLQGELTLPLNGDQEVYRYALDVKGKLREGVPVEKIKARQTFEAIVRRGVDPGLIQKSKGNVYKTAIYPISPLGKREVAIGILESLPIENGRLLYKLPLEGIDSIGHLKIEVVVAKNANAQISNLTDNFSNIQFDNQSNSYNLTFERNGFKPDKDLSFTLPVFEATRDQVYTTQFEGKTYFYLLAKAPDYQSKPKQHPESIAIFWDNSLSASKRDVSLELKVLSKYMEELPGSTKITIYPFNHIQLESRSFSVSDSTQLLAFIKALKNNGATRLDNLNFNVKANEILLFTDGINTLSKDQIKLPKVPAYTFNSAAGSNSSLLKNIAKKTNGDYIDLTRSSLLEAVRTLQNNTIKCTGVSYKKTDLQDIYPTLPTIVNGYVALAGILLNDKADISLTYGDKNESRAPQIISVGGQATDNNIVVKLWAKAFAQELDENFEQNKQTIKELGEKYGIVTRNTSLMVLENVTDYITYQITPPEELKEEYNRIVASMPKPNSDTNENITSENKQFATSLLNWYNANVINIYKKKKAATSTSARHRHRRNTIPIIYQEDNVREEEPIYNDVSNAEVVVVNRETSRNLSEVITTVQDSTANKVVQKKTTIALNPWTPDAPYLRILNATPSNQLDSTYYALRAKNENTPSFYIEVADFFIKKGNTQMGQSILLSLLDLSLENIELLKAAAYRLMQEKEYDTAILIYEEIKELRPEEPQSYRDLALAYLQKGDYQSTLDYYCFIMSKSWGRFNDIKEIILNEMNALMAAHKGHLNLTNVDKSLILPIMPQDIRVIMDWSSDNTDIDLWVDDPNMERCMYNHNRTANGGKISKDFTNGFGPEEFAIKNAPKGKYQIYANYYAEHRASITGPVTVYLSIFTRFGTSKQNVERIAIQLKERSSSQMIGSINFKPGKK